MNVLKIILKTIARIIHFVPATELQKIEYAKKHAQTTCSPSFETIINPASGLPMMGGVDMAGNTFGSNHVLDDWYRRHQHDDYHRYSSSLNSMQNDSYNHNRY